MNPNLRILIIDDNPTIHQDFIKILTRNRPASPLKLLDEELFGHEKETKESYLPQFEIDSATQGKEGVERIKKAIKDGKPYALAFVDVRMPPGWDGIETIKRIWKIDPDIQIVICTAFSDYSWEETIENLGLTDNFLILKKPFDNVAVRQLSCALTKKWQLMHDMKQHDEYLEQNIQERTEDLQKSLSIIRATFESTSDGIVIVNKEGLIVDYNNNFVEMLRISPGIIETSHYNFFLKSIIWHLKQPEAFEKIVKDLNNTPEKNSFDVIQFRDDRIFEVFSQPHKLENKIIGRIWNLRDVTERIHLEKRLEHQATHDLLTNLPNRVLLVDRVQQAISYASRSSTKVGIIFLDLDHFKLINDDYSHEIGDKLLFKVAERLQSVVRDMDTLSRLAGDEFVMLVSALQENEHLINIGNKILSSFKKPFKIGSRNIAITPSIGISIYPHNGINVDELLRNADLAMYSAKKIGGNQFAFYTPDMNVKTHILLAKEKELRQALANNEFFLFYQPLISLTTRKVVSAEALIRWKHPKKGILPPLDFIPLAEQTGLIIPIGEWVLKTACQQNKLWQESGLYPINVAVNISRSQFRNPNFVPLIKRILKETGLQPKYLEIELTESVISAPDDLLKIIQKIKKMGVQIVLDDFGKGTSSFNQLRNVPIDSVKIDRAFVKSIDSNRNDEILIQAIISMSRGLGLEVVAEGVETGIQLEYLENLQCNEAQGYYFSKPLPPATFEEFLRKYQRKK